jgi:Meiotically up-regulated gene 113/Homing endonuclease associated repeat
MRERVISEIRRIHASTGRVPGRQTFQAETGISQGAIIGKIWATWGDALQEAGFEANALRPKLDRDFILAKLAEACLKLGKWPSVNALKIYSREMTDFPSHSTLENHFPKRTELVEALRDWVLRLENHRYSEIADILPAPVRAPAQWREHQKYGHVYLLRAGDYFKIGQSSDLEKRVKSINVALPDKATLEHAISTDDPPGIEAYWHRRFADRRMNGEWFKLSKADVLVFKKRKFQ